jgi:hypothetical protein
MGWGTNVDWANVDWANVDWANVDKNISTNVGRED